MKKVLASLTLMSFIVGTLFLIQNHLQIPSSTSIGNEDMEEEEELSKETRIDKAIEQEFEMTKDPATQTIPKKRLFAARKIAKQKRASRAAIPGITWEERGPINVGGRTRALLFDANDVTDETVWAGSVGGGLWKTTNISATDPAWTPVNDFFENIAIASIAQDANAPNTMYFGTGEGWFNGDAIRGLGIWKSQDGGDTWNQLSSTSNSTFSYVQKLVIDDNGHLYACTRNGGIQKSTNEGDSWTQVLGSSTGAGTNRAADLEIAANGDLFGSMGIQSGDGIYKSTNDGSSWTELTNGLPSTGYERIELACAPSDLNYVYALYQSSSTNQCMGIYFSQNGGSSWSAVDNPSALGMSNFARNQAWYDLIIAVDPNQQETIYIGGVDLHVSRNGGTSWTQVSQWYGGGGYPYVHADQHEILFKPGSSSTILFGNDGGVFLTTNGQTNDPDFASKNLGYNVTQYYACAIHPEAEKNEYLAGAQDNGSQQYTTEGLNTTDRVTGGDGCFCHIDENEPDIQITSYVYNSYYISDDNWNTSSSSVEIGDSEGRFINPTDYDSDANILYGCYISGSYSYVSNVGTTNTTGSRTIAAFSSSKISAVTVSKIVDNRVYFGLANGDVVRVDNAHNAAASGMVVRAGSGYVSSIAIAEGDESHLLVTYSNYGTNSVWESTNSGVAWTSVEGDLPDMPVRWGMFAPGNNGQALLATEVGVWTTDNLNGGSTEWEPSNSGLANVRVDMLQYRTSDNQIIAATHGRGLFSTDAFGEPLANIQMSSAEHIESQVTDFSDVCRGYKDIMIPIKFTTAPPESVDVVLSVDESSTAEAGKDFIFLVNTLNYSPSSALLQHGVVRVYDDAFDEAATETLVVNMDGGDYTGAAATFTLTVTDDDVDPLTAQGEEIVTVGTGDLSLSSGPFGGFYHDGKTQILYLASELLAGGVKAGELSGLAFDINEISSTLGYDGFTVKMKHSSLTDFSGADFETGLTEVYSDDIEVVLGWNNFEFTNSFVWDGVSNLIIECCFNNNAYTLDDRVNATASGFQSVRYRRQDGTVGCNITTSTNLTATRPNIQVTQNTSIGIEQNLAGSGGTYLQAGETAHIYSDAGNALASIRQMSGDDISCIDFEITRNGDGIQYPTWLAPYGISDKVMEVTADNDEIYEITLYFTDAELNQWADEKLMLSMIKTEGAFADATSNNSLVAPFSTLEVLPFSDANHISYKGTFTGFSSFALTNAPLLSLPVELSEFNGRRAGLANHLFWTTVSETNNKGFEMERSFDGQQFESIAFVAGAGTVSNEQRYDFDDFDLFKKGLYYYRLKQVDLDGTFSYSETIVLDVETKRETSVSVFPNPAYEHIDLIWQTTQSDVAQLRVYDVNGRLIKGLSQTIHSNESQRIDLEKHGLTSGVYLLQLRNESGLLQTKRMVVRSR